MRFSPTAREVVASVHEVLGDALGGAYYVGSIALGGYVAGESDIDIVAVSGHAIPDQMRRSIAGSVLDTTMSSAQLAASSSRCTDARAPRRRGAGTLVEPWIIDAAVHL